MNLRHSLVLALALFVLGTTLRAQVTIEQMAADPKLWPREVKLTHAVLIQISDNGRPRGSVQGTVGMTLPVKKVEPGRLTVEVGAGLGAVAPGVTDILARVAGAAPAVSTAAPGAVAAGAAGRFENVRTGWKMVRGKWVVTSDYELAQNDNKDGVSNAYKSIPQSGKMEYRLKYKYNGGKSACVTIYIMCDDGEKTERGNAYLLVDALNEKGRAEFVFVKVTDDKTKEMKKLPSTPVSGQWIDFRATYDTATGVIEITRNGKVLGSWTDPEPLKTGKDFSIGTCMTRASFKEMEVRPLP